MTNNMRRMLGFGLALGMMSAMTLLLAAPVDRQAVRSEVRAAIRDYVDVNLVPTLTAWKARIDASLNAEDLATLEALRSRAELLGEKRRAQHAQIREALDKGEELDHASLRSLRLGLREEYRSLLAELRVLFEDKEALVSEIKAELNEKRPGWKEGIRDVVRGFKHRYSDVFTKHEAKFRHRLDDQDRHARSSLQREKAVSRPGLRAQASKLRRRLPAMLSLGRVLLWNGRSSEGVMPPSFDRSDLRTGTAGRRADMAKQGVEGTAQISMTSFPNPAGDLVTVNFSLLADDEVLLTILDGSGRELATLVNGPLAEGSHSIEFSPASIGARASAVYFCRLQTSASSQTQQLIFAP